MTTTDLPAVARPPLQVQLTVDETVALLECEAIIQAGRETFVQVGQALTRIRDSKLYRAEFGTFEDYCLKKWEISDRYARSLRSSADVVVLLKEKQFAQLPATESQARPITKLPREEWAPAWQEVIDGTERVTASRVQEVVKRRVDRLKGTNSPKPKIVDAGKREEQINATREQIEGKLRELRDLIGAKSDGMPVSYVTQAQWQMGLLREHLDRVGLRKESVQRANGLRPDNARRALDARMGAAL